MVITKEKLGFTD